MRNILFLFLLIIPITVFADSYEPAIIPQITINQNEDFGRSWQLRYCDVYNKSGVCVGKQLPLDITGCVIKAQAKKDLKDKNPFINFSTSIFNNRSGMFRFSLSKEKTITFDKLMTVYFDLYIQWVNKEIQYLMTSTILLKPTITR